MIKIEMGKEKPTASVDFKSVREGVFFSAFQVDPKNGIYMRIGDKLLTFQNNGGVAIMNYSNVALTPIYYENVTIAI